MAASKKSGRLLELGTGGGLAASWILVHRRYVAPAELACRTCGKSDRIYFHAGKKRRSGINKYELVNRNNYYCKKIKIGRC